MILEDKDLEVIGTPLIKYGDSTVIVQHVDTGLWLSYRVSGGRVLRSRDSRWVIFVRLFLFTLFTCFVFAVLSIVI